MAQEKPLLGVTLTSLGTEIKGLIIKLIQKSEVPIDLKVTGLRPKINHLDITID